MGRTERLEQPREFGKYQLTARLAHGRMGDVYKAKSHGVEGFEKILCVKVINPAFSGIDQFVEVLIDEVKRTNSLAHANVVQVYDLGQEETSGQYYVAMEYVNGFDLARSSQLRRLTGRDRPMELALFIASEVAKGLDYAHRRKDYNFNSLNLVHRDLSPHNVMMSFDGEVKITDFGVARALAHVPPIDNEDAIRRFLYMAPEVAQGQPFSQKSDIFSLGLLLYEMLSGTHPYRGNTPDEVEQQAAEGDIPPITEHCDIPRPLLKIIDSMLVPDPAGRAGNAGSLYEEMVAYIFGNNLRADTRALSLAMQELRREEQRVSPDQTTQEVGLEEISLSELSVLGDLESDDTTGLEAQSDATNAQLPSHRLQSLLGDGEQRPPLPGALEEYYATVESGRGKAVLVSGELGAGKNYLSDRLADALGLRGNTRAFTIQATTDDSYMPFGVLGDFISEAFEFPDDRQATLEHLRSMGIDDENIDTLAAIWDLGPSLELGTSEKKQRLAELFSRVVDDLCASGPLVVVVDHAERLDDVSLHVLRHIVGDIGRRAVMLVMCTANVEMTRSTFDVGRPENLEAVRVVGTGPPDPQTISGLTEDGSSILALIVLANRVIAQGIISQMLGIPGDRVVAAVRELSEAGLVRIPGPGDVIVGAADLMVWVEEHFSQTEIEQRASALARFYKHRVMQGEIGRLTPTLVRLHGHAGDRRQMLQEAQKFAWWLEREGWLEIALEFYKDSANLIASQALGAPHARIAFLLTRAELALEMSRINECRTTLEPIGALTEALRNERGAIRGQLLQGQMAMQQDDLEDALEHFRRATNAARSINDPDLLAFSLLALARWHDRYGDPLAGQQMLDGAMNLYDRWGAHRMDLRTRALMLNRAVRLMIHRGLRQRATGILEDLRALADSSPLPQVRCRADWAEATLHAANDEYADALKLLERGRHHASERGLTALYIELTREAAAVSLDGGDVSRTVDLADELISTARQHEDLYSAQRGEDLRATADCLRSENVDESLSKLMAGLRRARERQVPKDVYRAHLNLYRALDAVGRNSDAEQHRMQADIIAARMRYRAAS